MLKSWIANARLKTQIDHYIGHVLMMKANKTSAETWLRRKHIQPGMSDGTS